MLHSDAAASLRLEAAEMQRLAAMSRSAAVRRQLQQMSAKLLQLAQDIESQRGNANLNQDLAVEKARSRNL